jgi:hypothetical protein
MQCIHVSYVAKKALLNFIEIFVKILENSQLSTRITILKQIKY